MSKKNKNIIILIFIILFAGCKTPEFTVQNINTTDNAGADYIVYYLPATEIEVEVEVKKIIKNKGPYAQYAKEFLGNIRNVITENSVEWELGKIEIKTMPVRDTSQIWLINSNAPWIYLFSFTPEGFPLAYNKNVNYQPQERANTIYRTPEKITNFNFSRTIDKGFKEVYDTIYKKVQFDTIQRTVPIIKKRLIAKSQREQAFELANEIFTLRDDRAALLVGEGDSEYLPDGDALKVMLKGLDELEKQYLSQFTGRTDTIVMRFKLKYLPPKSYSQGETYQIFRFSEEKGVLPNDALEGEPVLLEITGRNTTKKINELNQRQFISRQLNTKKQQTGFVYRIPEPAQIKVTYKGQVISQKETLIAQYGSNFILPYDILKLEGVKIEFYPQYGSIKSIEY